MILDHRSRMTKYWPLHEELERVSSFVESADFNQMPIGRIDLAESRTYAVVSENEGKGMAGAVLEAHRSFIDVQFVLQGCDVIGWRDLRSCHRQKEPYDIERDIVFFDDSPVTWFSVPAEYFAIFFPDDAHAPLAGSGRTRKLVVKIPVLNPSR